MLAAGCWLLVDTPLCTCTIFPGGDKMQIESRARRRFMAVHIAVVRRAMGNVKLDPDKCRVAWALDILCVKSSSGEIRLECRRFP